MVCGLWRDLANHVKQKRDAFNFKIKEVPKLNCAHIYDLAACFSLKRISCKHMISSNTILKKDKKAEHCLRVKRSKKKGKPGMKTHTGEVGSP